MSAFSEMPLVLAAALEHERVGTLVFSEAARIVYGTACLQKLLGCSSRDLTPGSPLADLIPRCIGINASSQDRLAALLSETTNTPHEPLVLSSPDGFRTLAVSLRPTAEQCWIANFDDTSQHQETESHLRHLALQDPLTGIGNRLCFEQSLAAALITRPDSSAVILVDLDCFKAVNDTLGHAAGDAVLRLVSQRLQTAVRDTDVTARLGGDEFAILLSPAPSSGDLAVLAARIVDLLQRTYLVCGSVANIGASVGISLAPQDGDTPERLVRSADLALYQAKSSGRGRYHFFETAMEDRAQARRKLELDLRKALPLRQLEVYYKPQVDIATQTLSGFEAMIRWRHPARGVLTYEEFAPLADEIGLTLQIGDWLLRTACRDAARWPEHLGVCVSTSLQQFDNGHLAQAVRQALISTRASGAQLEIAITETTLLRNEQDVLATLHDLRSLGVRVAMDGFGTGYASLQQLASFPFDRVKINRELLEARSDNPRQRAIVQAIAALGASLGIATVAEGVESAAELERIHDEGCQALQGYLPSDGVPASDLPAVIAKLSASSRNEDRVYENSCL